MSWEKYPHNWKKVSKLLRRKSGRCELCLVEYEVKQLSVHHVGAPYPDRPGDPGDKHDLRRENLQTLCIYCHDAIDNTIAIGKTQAKRRARRRARFEAHRALGIGTGLVPVGVYA